MKMVVYFGKIIDLIVYSFVNIKISIFGLN